MRDCWVAILAIAAVFGLIAPAWADDVPNLHVEQVCRGIVSQSTDPLAGGEPTVGFDQCMDAERQDREQLQKEWPTFSADDKKHCVAESQMGGESSYTELMTCLEMARDVRTSGSSAPSNRGGNSSKPKKN
jgi:hypothetical protein